jgi:hypothetical protein
MNLKKSSSRDNKINRRRSGHIVNNRSIFTIVDTQKKKSLQIKKERELKEQLLEDESEG